MINSIYINDFITNTIRLIFKITTFTIYIFKCDSCGVSFLRPRAKVDPERASNDYKHVCSFCDTKKFAQKVGVKMRKIYRMDASSTQRL